MSAYVKAADRLREEFTAAVIIIHHCGINGERPRGHTSLTGACDAQIKVERDAADRIMVTVEHMKDGAEGDEIASRLEVVEVGLDEDDEPISSCIVVEDTSASSPARKRQRLPATQTRALQLLAEAINIGGQVPTASNHIPAGMRCVAETVWRDYCYAGSISKSDKPDAKRMAFTRCAEALVAAGRVGTWQTWVWPV